MVVMREKEEKRRRGEGDILAHRRAEGPTEGSTEVFADLKDVAPFLQSSVILWPPEQMSVMALVDKSDELDIRYPTWCSTPSKIQFRL